jgi:acetyltransferase-like isoleucine patch superfamily enzyme
MEEAMRKLIDYLHVKLRSWSWTGCLQTPRSDALVGTARWKWLLEQRRAGHAIDPSVEIRCSGVIRNQLQFGQNVAVDRGCILWAGMEGSREGLIRVGDRTRVGPYSYLGSLHRLEIGEGCLIGAYCYVITANHRFEDGDLPLVKQGFTGGDIRLGDHSWLGSQVVVLPGVSIGERAVVGAGAVVTKSIPAHELWGGVPARKIRDLRESETGQKGKGGAHATN